MNYENNRRNFPLNRCIQHYVLFRSTFIVFHNICTCCGIVFPSHFGLIPTIESIEIFKVDYVFRKLNYIQLSLSQYQVAREYINKTLFHKLCVWVKVNDMCCMYKFVRYIDDL